MLKLSTLRTFSFANFNRFFSLLIGMGCALAAFVICFDQLQSEQHIDEAENIALATVLTHTGGKSERSPLLSFAWAQALEFRLDDVLKAGRLMPMNRAVKTDDKSEDTVVAFIDDAFQSVIPLIDLQGAQIGPLKSPNSAVITRSFANEWFGETDIEGKEIAIKLQSSTKVYTIQSVLMDPPATSVFAIYGIYVPINSNDFPSSGHIFKASNAQYHQTFMLLKPGADLEALALNMDEIGRALNNRARSKDVGPYSSVRDEAMPTTLNNLFESHLSNPINEIAAPQPAKFITILILGVVILTLSLLNSVTITMVDLERRFASFAIMRLVGGSVVQVFMKDAVKILAVLFVSLLLSVLGLSIIQSVLFGETGGSGADLLSFLYAILGVLLTCLIIGIGLPAYFVKSIDPSDMLSGVKRKSWLTALTRKGGVLVQVIATTTLVTLSLAMTSQMKYLENEDLGYDIEQLYVVDEQSDKSDWRGNFKARTSRKFPGVEIADAALFRAFSNPGGLPYKYTRQGNQESHIIWQVGVTDNFFNVLGSEFLAGGPNSDTNLTRHASAAPVVVNESLVKALGWNSAKDAIGQIVIRDPYDPELAHRFTSRKEIIVGVIRDMILKSPSPVKFRYSYSSSNQVLTTFLRIPNQETVDAVRQELLSSTSVPVELKSISKLYDRVYLEEKNNTTRVRRLSMICVMLSFIGLFGLIGHAVTSRRSTFALRHVLGAAWWDQLGLLARDVLPITTAGLFIGAAFGYLLAEVWLSTFVNRINSTHESTFIAVIIGLFIVITASAWPIVSLSPRRVVSYMRRG